MKGGGQHAFLQATMKLKYQNLYVHEKLEKGLEIQKFTLKKSNKHVFFPISLGFCVLVNYSVSLAH